MTAQHTPGPWRVAADYRGTHRVYADTHEIVRALSTHGLRRVPAQEREANRRLIAAAPLMLEALRAVDSVGFLLEEWAGGWEARDKVHAAIAAATGEDA